MKDYQPNSNKNENTKRLINEALDVLEAVGIPFDRKTESALERMAQCLLAVAGITNEWTQAKDNTGLKTRDIIEIVNQTFGENISSGSYDDIRRKHLKLLVLADLVVNTGAGKGSATNDPTRGYSLSSDFAKLIIKYKTPKWKSALKAFNKKKTALSEVLARKRNIEKVPVKLPDGVSLALSAGEIGRAHV